MTHFQTDAAFFSPFSCYSSFKDLKQRESATAMGNSWLLIKSLIEKTK